MQISKKYPLFLFTCASLMKIISRVRIEKPWKSPNIFKLC
jgi:hypothetical protein